MISLSDFFRSIFGPFKQKFGPNDLPRNIHEDFEELYGWIPDQNWQQPTIGHEEWSVLHGHPDSLEISDGEVFQEFEHLFQDFFRGFPFDVVPQIQGPPARDLHTDLPSEMPAQERFPKHSESLREQMLKRPNSSFQSDNFELEHKDSNSDWFPSFGPFSLFSERFRVPFDGPTPSPGDQIDRDLDSEVEMGTQSLDDILSQRNQDNIPQHVPHSSASSFSSVTIIDSNGVTEKRTTRRNSCGKEEVTVTRKVGDQTHTITHRKDGSGNEETQEDLVNIDDDGLAEFNERWDHSKYRGKRPHLLDDDASRQTPLSSIYDSILEKFFAKR